MDIKGSSTRFPKFSGIFSKQLPVLLLLGIIAFGTYARLVHSADVSLCMDESWRIACLLDAENLVTQMFVGMNRVDPPLFNLFLYILGKLYNVEFVLRLASIVPGILAIPLAYLVGRNLFSNRWIAVLSSFLTAFSLELMVWSKELRPYSLCAFVHLCILYGYLKYRNKINVRTTVVFTILLALSIPLSLHSAFAFPGVYLALFAGAVFHGTRKQKKLVLFSCIFLLIFSSLCFFLLIGNIEDDSQLNFMKGYWNDDLCPTESWWGVIGWLSPRYISHYSDLAFSNPLAPRLISDHLHVIYPTLAMLGFFVLLLRSRWRFFEASCLFVVPLVVMAVFSIQRQWPFGLLRMNLFVFFYVLFPPLFILDEIGKIPVKIRAASRFQRLLSCIGVVGAGQPKLYLSPIASCVAIALICIQFPLDFREFSHSRIRGCWQASAQTLEHILDVYTDGPRIPLVCNHLGQSQFRYYSNYHKHISAKYQKQAELFDPRGMPTRRSRFYLRGAMLRVCQESRQAAIYLSHYLGREAMIYNNEFCIEHDRMKGHSSHSCLITSEIYDAARSKQQIFSCERFSGGCSEWEQVFTSPPLKIEDARPGALIVFNFDIEYHSADKRIRLSFLDENKSGDHFDRSSTEYKYPVKNDYLESAACIKLRAPVDYVILSISARDNYDFTINNLNYFVANEESWKTPDRPFRIAEDMCENIQLRRRIKDCREFMSIHRDGFGWTSGYAEIELDEMDIDPTERVFMLETYGFMVPEFRQDIMTSGLKIYINGHHRAPFMKKEGENAQKYYFHIPADVRTVKSIIIKSNTFVPKDLGINDDERPLGIDVKSIDFPWIVHEGHESRGPHLRL